MINVLLVTPNQNLPGGVSSFNKLLKKYSKLGIHLFELTGSGKSGGSFVKGFYFINDIVRFIFCLSVRDYHIVHLSPSLAKNAIKRDAILCKIAKLFKKKVYVHWHGWNPDNEYLLEKPYSSFLKKSLFQADHIKFLSNTFCEKFIDKGFQNKTSIGNTFIDDQFLENYDTKQMDENELLNILFLSTISKNKGIYLVLDAFKILSKNYKLSLTIAGSGPELENITKMVEERYETNVKILGYVTGVTKRDVFKNADIYILPSYYEGMPTSVIEAMGFGLPVICSSVGAIPDFFINGKMGYTLDEISVDCLVSNLKILLNDIESRRAIGKFNHQFAVDNFSASSSIKKIDKEYCSLIQT